MWYIPCVYAGIQYVVPASTHPNNLRCSTTPVGALGPSVHLPYLTSAPAAAPAAATVWLRPGTPEQSQPNLPPVTKSSNLGMPTAATWIVSGNAMSPSGAWIASQGVLPFINMACHETPGT